MNILQYVKNKFYNFNNNKIIAVSLDGYIKALRYKDSDKYYLAYYRKNRIVEILNDDDNILLFSMDEAIEMATHIAKSIDKKIIEKNIKGILNDEKK